MATGCPIMFFIAFIGAIRCRPVETAVQNVLGELENNILNGLLPTETSNSQTEECTTNNCAATTATTEQPGLNSVLQGLGSLTDNGGALANVAQAVAAPVQTVVANPTNLQGLEALGMTAEDIKALGTLDTIGKVTSGSIIPSSSTSTNPLTATFSNPIGLLGSLLGSTKLGNSTFSQKYLDVIIALCQFWLNFLYQLLRILLSSQSTDVLLSLIIPAYMKLFSS